MADADGDISAEEIELMETILQARAGLSKGQAKMVVDLAVTENITHGPEDDTRVARIFATVTDHEARIQLVDALFAVASADDVIQPLEATAVRRVAEELGLTPGDVEQISVGYEQFFEKP